MRDAEILDSEEERGPSDHVPLFVKLGVGLDEGAGGQGRIGTGEQTEDLEERSV